MRGGRVGLRQQATTILPPLDRGKYPIPVRHNRGEAIGHYYLIETTLCREVGVAGPPVFWWGIERAGDGMCGTALERRLNGLLDNSRIGQSNAQEQQKIDEILHTGVCALSAWERVGMDLLSELLLAGKCLSMGRGNTSEAQHIGPGELFWRGDDCVADANIQVEGYERAVIQASLDRITCSPLGSRVQVDHRLPDTELKAITKVNRGRVSQMIEDDGVCIECCFTTCRKPLQIGNREVEILGRPSLPAQT